MLIDENGRMTQEGLKLVGETLFGERWKSPVSGILGLQSSRIRDVMRGARPAPAGWTPDILSYLKKHLEDCQKVLDMLQEDFSPRG